MGHRPFDYEEYDDLVGLGYGRVEIAARFGILPASLDRAVARRPKIADPPPAEQTMTADKPRRGPPRTAAVFDAQAIADRVVAREQAARNAQPAAAHKPLHHDDGPVRTGTGDGATHIPLPAKATVHVDLFDRLAAAEERRAVHSPFGDHPPPADHRDRIDYRALARLDLAEIDVLDRFTAPELDDDLWDEPTTPPDLDEDDTMDTPGLNLPSTTTMSLRFNIGAPTACTNDACGQLLTGGGAPRGWVLVRIIGNGAPRRYCSPACAAKAILDSQPVAKVASKPRRGRPRVTDHDADILRLAGEGRTIKEIVNETGMSRAVVNRRLAEARSITVAS